MSQLNVLHVCSFFYTSSLYRNLFETLNDKGIYQQVFIPMYTNKVIKRRDYENKESLIYTTKKICNNIDRYFLKKRIKKIASYVLKRYCLEEYDIVHAHSLLANGGVCYEMYKKNNNIKYITAVRMTDLEVLKKLPWYKKYAMEIIENSCKIIFISETLKNKFIELLKIRDQSILDKFTVIPNGILDFWYEENKDNLQKENSFSFIYQGSFLPRKNIFYSLEIIKNLIDLGINCTFNIYGGEDLKQKKILETYIINQSLQKHVHLCGWVKDLSDIKRNYSRAHAFIMPSKNETFGISYIEALACGIPVIYLENDGIDGMLDSKQGIALRGNDIKRDTRKVLDFIKNYNIYKENVNVITFKWKDIADKYVEIYKK